MAASDIVGIAILFVSALAFTAVRLDVSAVSAVIATSLYGLAAGLFVGVGSKALSLYIYRHFTMLAISQLVALAAISYIAFIFPSTSLFWYPLFMYIIYGAMTMPLIKAAGSDLTAGILHFSKDLLSSLIYVSIFGPMMLLV